MVICSSFVIAKRKDATHYDLSGESFQLTGVTADQVYVFDDSVVITEGMELTHSLIEWVTISFSRGSSQPRDRTRVSRIGGRCFNL